MAKGGGAKPFGHYERMLALRYLGAKRAQGGVGAMAVISFLGILIAVFVLIVTMSIMNGFRETLLSRILGVGGHVIVDVRGRSLGETQALAKTARALPQVVHVAPLVQGQALANLGPNAAGALVQGIDKRDLQQLPIIVQGIKQGSLDRFDTDEDGASRVVMGIVLAQQLGLTVGDSFTLVAPQGAATPFGYAPRRKSYEIGAIFDAGFYEVNAAFVYLPLDEAQRFFARGEGVDRLEVRIKEPDRSEEAMAALRTRLGADLYFSDWKAQSQSLVTALIVERNVMRMILMMVVAIAAMNIISGLVMLVKNKARDVAILRTMGASRGAILRIFLMIGAILGAGGALTGAGLAALFCIFIGPIQAALEAVTRTQVFDASIYSLSRVPASLEPLEVISVLAFAIVMSILAAFFPARGASRLDPVEALRYE